jgi:hypothetical protein
LIIGLLQHEQLLILTQILTHIDASTFVTIHPRVAIVVIKSTNHYIEQLVNAYEWGCTS